MQPEDQYATLERSSLILGRDEIESNVERVAREIEADYRDKFPLFVVIMRGGMFFAADLLGRLTFPLQIEHVDVTRYHNRTYGSDLVWNKGIDFDVRDRMVVLLDDVFDEGITIEILNERFLEKGAAGCEVCVLLVKDRPNHVRRPKYFGALVPDKYLFGRGMDVRNAWRQLPDVRALEE